MFSHRKQHGFTLIELSIVILVIAFIISITFPALYKRAVIREIDNTVSEAQMIANYADSLRRKWLISTDTASGVYIHRYNSTHRFGPWMTSTDSYTVDELPFGMNDDLPEFNHTGHPYEVITNDDTGFVRTIIGTTDSGEQAQIMSQLQSNPLVKYSSIESQGVEFIVVGKPNTSFFVSQVGKSKFDKAFLYNETIR